MLERRKNLITPAAYQFVYATDLLVFSTLLLNGKVLWSTRVLSSHFATYGSPVTLHNREPSHALGCTQQQSIGA